MTSCLVKDLTIIEGELESWFHFKWSGTDFLDAVAEVKAAIPPEARSYDELTNFWRVSDCFEDVLAGIFRNFHGAVDAIRSQISLFEEVR